MALHLNETEVKYHRIKIDNVLTEVYHIPSSTNNTAILFCYGIPSHPFDRFPFGLESYLRQGYALAYPHYEGTFGSDGVCTIENTVDSVVTTAQALLAGKFYNLAPEDQLNIKPQRIILAGGSFGGSVALIAAAKSDEIKDVISVAGPITYKGRIFSRLESRLKSYGKEWNISCLAWENFLRGKADINPIDYVDKLKKKNTYLIHGETDAAVSADHSIRLHEMLKNGSGKHRVLIGPNVGHIGCHYIGAEHIHELIESWLKE